VTFVRRFFRNPLGDRKNLTFLLVMAAMAALAAKAGGQIFGTVNNANVTLKSHNVRARDAGDRDSETSLPGTAPPSQLNRRPQREQRTRHGTGTEITRSRSLTKMTDHLSAPPSSPRWSRITVPSVSSRSFLNGDLLEGAWALPRAAKAQSVCRIANYRSEGKGQLRRVKPSQTESKQVQPLTE
jgi:hypothetical protein